MLSEALILISTPPHDVVSVNKERSEGVRVLCPLGTRRRRTADCPSSAQLSPPSEHEGMQLHLEPSGNGCSPQELLVAHGPAEDPLQAEAICPLLSLSST